MTGKNGEKQFIGILCVCVLLHSSVAMYLSVTQQNVVEDDADLQILPSKSCYPLGEDVWGVFRVAGTQPLGGFRFPYFLWVWDTSGHLVFHFDPYRNETVELRLGESAFFKWNQTNDDGNQVPEGNYTVRVGWDPGWVGNHTNVSSVIGEVNISIGECPPLGLHAYAGRDQTLREGEETIFNGSASHQLPLGCQDEDFSRNIKINDESSRRTVHTNSRTMDIKVEPNGTVHVVWSDFRNGDHDVFYSKSMNGGKTFLKNVKVNSDVTTRHQWKPSMAVDFQGTIHVAWEDTRSELGGPSPRIFYSRSEDGGATFEEEILISEGTEPSTAVDSEGRVHIVYIYSDILHVISNESDLGFSPPTRVNDVHDFVYPGNIAIDLIDDLHVVWRQSDGISYDDILYAKSTDHGKSFSNSVKVRDGGPTLFLPDSEIAVDSYGNPHVVWSENRRGFKLVGEVYYAYSSDGGRSFNPNIAVHERLAWVPEDGYQIHPSLAIDELNNVHVVWSQNTIIFPLNSDIYYARKMEGEDSFSFVEEVRDNCVVSKAYDPNIALSPEGVSHIAWYDLRNHWQWDVYFSKRDGLGEDVVEPDLYWDLNNQVDSDGDGNFTNDMDAAGPTPTHIYGDNGNFTVTLRATDRFGGWSIDTMNVTVLNIPPEVTVNYTYVESGPFDIFLRISGEKWHDVSFTIYEDDVEIHNDTVFREPGSPNEQMIGLEKFAIDAFHSYSAIVRYTPEDDPVNGQIWGATPAWLIITYDNEERRMHHTFNVRQEDTWIWNIEDLNQYFPLPIVWFEAIAHDPGSDDLKFTWDFGDGSPLHSTVYFNNAPLNTPDPYPSPEVNPTQITDSVHHSFFTLGPYSITLTVEDDDGGLTTSMMTIEECEDLRECSLVVAENEARCFMWYSAESPSALSLRLSFPRSTAGKNERLEGFGQLDWEESPSGGILDIPSVSGEPVNGKMSGGTNDIRVTKPPEIPPPGERPTASPLREEGCAVSDRPQEEPLCGFRRMVRTQEQDGG